MKKEMKEGEEEGYQRVRRRNLRKRKGWKREKKKYMKEWEEEMWLEERDERGKRRNVRRIRDERGRRRNDKAQGYERVRRRNMSMRN